MKRIITFLAITSLLSLSFLLVACNQNQNSANREDLSALIEKMDSLQSEVNSLRQENQKLRSEVVKSGNNYNSSASTSVKQDSGTKIYPPPSESSGNTTYNSQQSQNTIQPIYWLNTSSNVRHNRSCKWYNNTKRGRPCTKSEGKACGICGG